MVTGLVLPRACHSGEIALSGSYRLRPMLTAAPVLFADADVAVGQRTVVSAPLCNNKQFHHPY